MEKWTIRLCENANGKGYVESDILLTLESKNKLLFDRFFKRMEVLTRRDIFDLKRGNEIKPLGDAIFEIRFYFNRLHIRLLGYFDYSLSPPTFFALVGFMKKTNKIPIQKIELAKERYKEFRNIHKNKTYGF
ncbi:MAG: type II toxin-antitoxin system RelE/ParE family toxin [Candidatus Paceibacterota bacterium]|jgi:hypothetical protein